MSQYTIRKRKKKRYAKKNLLVGKVAKMSKSAKKSHYQRKNQKHEQSTTN